MGKQDLRRRFFSFSLALCMILALFPVPTRATVYEGDCGADGANVQWAFDDETGVLTITGSGAMADYPSEYNTPWTDYHNYSITSVQIGEGVKSVGNYAFQNCYNLTDVSLPSTLKSVGDYAFYCCNSIPSITFPEGLESIGNAAFTSCRISSVTIPATVKSIGEGTFNSCTSLSSVTLSEELESIANDAFNYCESLTSVTIPASVKSIGDRAFFHCSYLSSITLSEGLESIGYNAFGSCYNLSSLTIPKSVTEINPSNEFPVTPTVYFDTYAWRYCISNNISCNVLEGDGKTYTAVGECGADGAAVHWKLDDSGLLTIYGSGAMSDCDSYYGGPWYSWSNDIKTVAIQSGVTSVGANAFYGYSGSYSYPNLTAVSFPDSLTSIGQQAFYNCDALTSVAIPAKVAEIGSSAFGDCENLTLTVTEHTPGYGYALRDNIPFKLAGGDTVYSHEAGGQCGENVYWTFDDDTLTIFGSGDMESAPMLPDRNAVKTVDIQSGVTTIGDGAFSYCDALKSIVIPDSVTAIGNNAFYNCDALASVTFPVNLVSIGNYAFYCCPKLIAISLPDSVTSVGEYAFYNCDALASLTLSANLASIGDYAFQYCYALRSLTIPGKVSEIGKYAFQSCNRLTALTIPATVQTIGEGAFQGCGELLLTVTQDSGGHTYALGDGVPFKLADDTTGAVRVGGKCGENVSWLLDWKSGLLEITGSGDMTSYPWSSYNDKIKTVTIASGVTSIYDYAFQYCYSLTSVTLPDSLTSIGYQAFYNCSSLASLVIPDSVSSIGSGAFQYCYALASVTLPAKLTKIETSTFYACNALTSVTIPNSVQSIDREAFYSCGALKSVTIPASVVSIDDSAFSGCPNVVLTVTEDSEAHTYAVRNNVSFRFAGTDTVYHRGTCGAELGDDVTWILDSNGLMTISGSGNMQDFNGGDTPWNDFREQIKSVSVADGVTSIGSYAFYDCDALESVTLPASVTFIDYDVFSNCAKLVLTVKENDAAYTCALRDGVRFRLAGVETTYRGGYCGSDDNSDSVAWLLDSTGLLTIKGSGDMREFGWESDTPWYNFREQIKSVSIVSGVTSVGSYAFRNSDALESVTIENGVVSIGSEVFNNCDALTSITIGDSVTSIGSYAFYDCDALASVAIPVSVTSIGFYAFYDCEKLVLTVTKDSPSHDYAMSSHTRYRLAGSDTVYMDWGDCGEKDENGNIGGNAKWVFTDDGLLKISGSGAMSDYYYEWDVSWSGIRDSVLSVEIEKGITRIGNYAFYECNNLASVTVPDSVTSIGNAAFYGCDALSALTLHGNVAEISGDAFASCGGLVVTVPDNSATRQAVGKAGIAHKLPGSESVYLAFGLWGAESSQAWTLESNGILTVSGKGAVIDYDNSSSTPWASVRERIRTVIVKDGVTQIGSYAFAECGSLEKAFLAASVKTLGERAFSNNQSLTSVSLEEGLNSIGANAFSDCASLAALTVPESVTSIGSDAFNTYYYYYSDTPFMLTVYNGSDAMKYAEDHSIPHTTITRGTANVSGVTLNESSLALSPGQTFLLSASVQPDDAKNKKVTWSSDNSAVASVDEHGIVRAVSEGSANVTATTDNGGKAASCTVAVMTRIPASVIVLNVSRKALKVGGEFDLTATVFPENASDKTVTWSTSDGQIASIYNYEDYYGYGSNTVRVKKEGAGTAVITARSADGSIVAECEILEHLAVTGVRIDKKSIILKQGGEDALSATVLPEGASNENVSWSCSDYSIAEVSEDGKVTGKAHGKATLIATTEDGGFTAFCLVEVTNEVTNVEKITLNRENIPSLEFGTSMQLVATITPPNATNQAIMWTSSAPEVVAVSDDGVVTAFETGKTAVITAMTADGGYRASCVVTVADSRTPTELRVYAPGNLTAVRGSPLNLAGVSVEAVYGNIPEPVSDYSVYDYNRDRVGPQTVVISYKGKSASLDITVVERYAERLLIAQSPDKREYAIGEELDLSGLILQAEYNDQTLETVTDIAAMTAVGFRSDMAGVYPVTVKWNDLYSSAFYVTILAESDEPASLTAPKMNIVGYPGGKRVELSAVPGAEIRYEIGENSVPSFDSKLYQEPIPCEQKGTTVIKAVAFLNGEMSAVTVSRVFVDEVQPIAASHDNNAQLPAGTLVTLRTPTDGATIRYTTDGSEPSASSPLYSSGVLVNADMTLKAIAVKDGARNSETFTANYKAESRTDAQSAATISIASVTSRAGERASMPVYLFTDGGEKVTFFRFAISFDRRAFEFVSVSPAEGISASNLMVSSGANSGKVTVMYDAGDGNAMESGEAFTLTLRALDSSEDGAYDMRLSAEDGITIRAGNASPLVNQTPGVITLSGSHNSQLTGEISLQDEDGNKIDALQDGQDQINVSFSLDPYAAQSDSALTAMADVYLVLYDDKGLMLDIQTWNIELKNVWLAFSQVKQVPPEIKGKIDKIKIMILSEDMTPIMAASEL